MGGWVGLVDWPIADTYHEVVTCIPCIRHRSGKDRRPSYRATSIVPARSVEVLQRPPSFAEIDRLFEHHLLRPGGVKHDDEVVLQLERLSERHRDGELGSSADVLPRDWPPRRGQVGHRQRRLGARLDVEHRLDRVPLCLVVVAANATRPRQSLHAAELERAGTQLNSPEAANFKKLSPVVEIPNIFITSWIEPSWVESGIIISPLFRPLCISI